MDYFNQYTFAEVTAHMISEIAYTETLTFWSTFISSFAMYAGLWAVGGGTLQSFMMAGVVAVKSAIFEIFDEIVKDSFIEALIENTVDMWGWSEDAAMWLSALGTSARETFGALGKLMRGFTGKTNLQTDIALLKSAVKAGDLNAQVEIAQRIDQARQEQQEKQRQDQEQKSAWAKLIKSGFFKGIFMVMPAIFFGSFNFLTLKGLSTIGSSTINLALREFAGFKAKVNAFKKKMIKQLAGENARYHWKGLKAMLKKPTDLDSKKGDVNNIFKDQQESDNLAPPLVDVLNSINSQRNTKEIQAREDLALKFNEIQDIDFPERIDSIKKKLLTQLSSEGDINLMNAFYVKEEIAISNLLNKLDLDFKPSVFVNNKEVYSKDFESFVLTPQDEVHLFPSTIASAKDVRVNIPRVDNFEGLFPEYDKDRINYIHSKLFDPNYDQNKPHKVLDQIIYRSDLILEARAILKSTKYNGLEIIVGENMNPAVIAILQDRFNKGEEWSKLERIIADVASFYLSGNPPGSDDTTSRVGGNLRYSEKFRQNHRLKMQKFEEIIVEQLQHYSRTGKRLYTLEEAANKAEWSANTGRIHSKAILNKIFRNPINAKLVYDLIFGIITTSYQRIKQDSINKGFILLTTPTQWFEMLKNRDVRPSRLHVELQHDDHTFESRIDDVRCSICGLEAWEAQQNKPLNFQNILDIGEDRNIQAVSFIDPTQPLTEAEFNQLLETYKAEHQDPDDYKSKSNIFINLKWRCNEGHYFEKTFYNVRSTVVKEYCPIHIKSLAQQRTMEIAQDIFIDHITQSFQSDVPLTRSIPNSRVLLDPKYQAISHGGVHVDAFGIVQINNRIIHIAIEYQGPQHSSFVYYRDMRRRQDLNSGLQVKSDAEYRQMYNDQLARDEAKVELFENLNGDDYYLIVIDYTIPYSKMDRFLRREFLRQTGIDLLQLEGQTDISDWL